MVKEIGEKRHIRNVNDAEDGRLWLNQCVDISSLATEQNSELQTSVHVQIESVNWKYGF